MLWLMLLGSAQAARWDVVANPNSATEFDNIAEAIEAAQDGDKIFVEPGAWVVSGSLFIDKDIEIHGDVALGSPNSPNGEGPDSDTKIIIDYDDGAAFGEEGVFVIEGATVVISDLMIKGLEWICGDKWDNDGNGYKDSKDPFCVGYLDSGETAVSDSIVIAGNEYRAFTVKGGANVTLDRMWVQGMSYAHNGGAMLIKGSSTVTIDNSLFVHNETFGFFDGNYWVTEGFGGSIHVKNSDLTITYTDIWRSRAWRGGGIYAEGSNITLSDNVLWENYGGSGAAIYTDDNTQLVMYRNFVSGNFSNLLGQESVDFWPYHNGVVTVEDSHLSAYNNVFNNNETLDYGSAITAIRGVPSNPQPPVLPSYLAPGELVYDPHIVVNNTFVSNLSLIDGGTARFNAVDFIWTNNIAAWNTGGVLAAEDFPGLAMQTGSGLYNLYYLNDPISPYHHGELSVFPVDVTTNLLEVDPILQDYVAATTNDPAYWNFHLDPLFSPAIDMGDPSIFDPGGSRSDIGASGGPYAIGVDYDGDGWEDIYDCNDTLTTVYPGAVEDCDGIDNDCNGTVDDLIVQFYPDNDGDGFGAAYAIAEEACPGDALPPNTTWVTNNLDCDDTEPSVYPDAEEICDSLDNDCDDQIDEDLPAREQYPDFDGDHFGDDSNPVNVIIASCPSVGYTPVPGDCDDGDPNIHPAVTQEHWLVAELVGVLEINEFDRDPSYVADGIDQDCDGGDLCYYDADGDGYGRPATLASDYYADNDLICANLSAPTAINDEDCDDFNPLANPDGEEIVGNNLDEDCDGVEVCFVDDDGDGYGDPDRTVKDDDTNCTNANLTSSTTNDGTDCDDTRSDINPQASEVCDGADNDCDGEIDEVIAPEDVDRVATYYADLDADGYGDAAASIEACGLPAGFADNPNDCDDTNPDVFPTAAEVCDDVDNDCNGEIDEPDLAIDVVTWIPDDDGDGYGSDADPGRFLVSCDEPESGYVRLGAKAIDCDDSSSTTGPCVSCLGASSTGAAGLRVPALLALLMAGVARRRKRSVA